MKKYLICSFCILLILCSAYAYSFNKISITNKLISEEKIIPVNQNHNTIHSDSILITENCIIQPNGNKDIQRTQSVMPAIYLGMTKEDVHNHLTHYMNNLSINDLENGLIQFDLIYFAPNCLIVRKTYETNEDYHKYYVKFTKGYVTVFYSDQKTVYEYTDIALTQLPPDIAAKTLTGFKIKNEKELFDFLENYSS